MTKKKMPQTIEECNAEMERAQKQIRQYGKVKIKPVLRDIGGFAIIKMK